MKERRRYRDTVNIGHMAMAGKGSGKHHAEVPLLALKDKRKQVLGIEPHFVYNNTKSLTGRYGIATGKGITSITRLA